MLELECLPRVEYCCFVISLKLGALLIALFEIFFVGFHTIAYFSYPRTTRCRLSDTEAGFWKTIIKIFRPLFHVGSIFLIVSAIGFIAGLFLRKPIMGRIFAVVMLSVFFLQEFILLIEITRAVFHFDNCWFSITYVVFEMILICLTLYFAIVINSYTDEMEAY